MLRSAASTLVSLSARSAPELLQLVRDDIGGVGFFDSNSCGPGASNLTRADCRLGWLWTARLFSRYEVHDAAQGLVDSFWRPRFLAAPGKSVWIVNRDFRPVHRLETVSILHRLGKASSGRPRLAGSRTWAAASWHE